MPPTVDAPHLAGSDAARVNGAHPTPGPVFPLAGPGLDVRSPRPVGTAAPREAADRSGHTPTDRPNRPVDRNTRTTAPTGRDDNDTDRPNHTTGSRLILGAVSVALGAVLLAPVALSSQDLYDWATAARGLGLRPPWPLLVPVALDLAASACIGMTIVAAWRRDRPGVFGLLVWVFALVSAFAQFRHGWAERDAGRAQDAFWAMPGFALLGPLLLEVTLHRIRRWAREDTGEQHTGAAGFGKRWLPGVAFWETLAAWAASRREGIDRAQDAIDFVRQRKALVGVEGREAAHYAFAALQSTDPHEVRTWLADRGVSVDQDAIDRAVVDRERAATERAAVEAARVLADRSVEAAREATVKPTGAVRREPTDRPTVTASKRPTGRPEPARPVAPTDSAAFSAAVVANAAELRRRYPTDLPSDYRIKQDTNWSQDRVKPARAAYLAGADINTEGASK